MKKKIILSEKHIEDAYKDLPSNIKFLMSKETNRQLAEYVMLLMQWNKKINLVGIDNWLNCLQSLIVDSLYLADFINSLPYDKELISWDLGAGGGLPGVPLRMFWNDGEYLLVESREKRSLFLSTVLAHIPLIRTKVFSGRAEDLFADSGANLIISRAFMPWQMLLPFIEPHLYDDGRIICLTLEQAPLAEIKKHGFELEAEYAYNVRGGERYFWSLKKS